MLTDERASAERNRFGGTQNTVAAWHPAIRAGLITWLIVVGVAAQAAPQQAPSQQSPPQQPGMQRVASRQPLQGDTDATSSRAARAEAVRRIPWQQMSPSARQTTQQILNNASIFRRLPRRVIDCEPELFTFLMQHPEVVIDVWRIMGITQVSLEKRGNGAYLGTDGAGTNGTVQFLFSNWGPNANNVAVVQAAGAYTGPPFVVPLKAKSIMVARSHALRETNGRYYITVEIDSFVEVEQLGVEIIAKTVQPWINKTADLNTIETLTFVSNFSRTAEKNPQGMQRLASRLGGVDETTRKQLIALCYRTAEQYANARGPEDPAALLAHSVLSDPTSGPSPALWAGIPSASP
ncbi:MAG: hypothetical protein IT425_13545 [Pirellulales bacterium]|nr:hypothetical protein [Pirellulales bacterium]